MDRSVALERLVIAAVVLLTGWGIWAHGLWDPWELGLADGSTAGRFPGVIAGWLTCALSFVLLDRHAGRRAAVVVIAVIASTPLFLLNARLMMGDSLGMFAQTWVGLAAIAVCSGGVGARRETVYYALLGLGIAISTHTSGVLLGPLPPILAVATWSLLTDEASQGPRVWRWLLPITAAVLTLGVVRAVSLDDPGFSHWLGGGSVGGNPPTFDKAGELAFHGLAPWSAALPVAAISVLIPRSTRSRSTQNLAWVLLLWAAFAFVSWTVFASRYGSPPYLALVPLAGLIAIWLTEVTSEPVAHWPSAVVVALLVGLLIRDYALYPDSPLQPLAVDGLSVPDVYNPRGLWALVLSLAGVLLCLTLVSHDAVARPKARRTVDWFRGHWELGGMQRGWLLLVASLLAACLSFGLMCFVLDLRISSVVVRGGRAAFFVPIVLAALVFGLPWLRYAVGRLGGRRVFLSLAGGLVVGAFVTLSFQPSLSQHFSPKPVYDAYNDLTAGSPSPLASFKVPSTAARYYTEAPVQEIGTRAELLRFLREDGQRWAVIPADDLAELDRAYRRSDGRHLYVADARNTRLLLIAAQPIDGRPNANFLEKAVVQDAPVPQHPVDANYDDRVELVGYDLLLPEEDSVGAGQRFQLTWYWRALSKVPSGYTVFVHIDGYGLRLNGDHTPVDGQYPTKLWEKGDVIIDTQEITVPANYPVGEYTIYVGLFSGSKRLKVKAGPEDGGDRVNAGTLRVR